MKLKPLAVLAALLITSTASYAEKIPPALFETFAGTKKISEAKYTLKKTKTGIEIRSDITYPTDSQGQVTNAYHVGNDGILDDAALRASADKSLIMYTPSKTNDVITVDVLKNNQSVGGRKVPLQSPGDLVIAFTDDPSAFEVLIRNLEAHPHTNSIYTLYVPMKGDKTDRFEPYQLMKKDEARASSKTRRSSSCTTPCASTQAPATSTPTRTAT
ncbi:hypothetical protein ACFQBQ_05070 [Granulicella cerasi]|uniref:Uncharacterized protein n=1 Tax=Granulicella cerasi TaxID=741063 RepID=A0ABW1Z6K4_9BACT